MFNDEDDEQKDDFALLPQVDPAAQAAMIAPADPSAVAGPPAPAPGMNPAVKDYIAKKFNLGDYSPEKRQALVDQSAPNFGDRLMAGLAAAGAGISGGNAAQAGMARLNAAKEERGQKLKEFDEGRKSGLEYDSQSRAEDLRKRESSLDSQESKMAQELATRMGYKGKPVTASQFKSFSPAMEKIYDIEQKKLDRQEARDERRYEHGIKRDEKMEGLKTPFGLAHNEGDAKSLKEAHESKRKFDEQINEMIALREKHGGGATMNRQDVARGKALSKDLLLEYKNMAKLGVLSKSDEDIINKIIPEDPLAYNSPLAAIQGQDPILHVLKKFKGDSDKDFSTRVATRVRGGGTEQAETKTLADGRTVKKVPGGWKVINPKQLSVGKN